MGTAMLAEVLHQITGVTLPEFLAKEVFGPLGVTNIRTFVNPENPTRVAVLMDVADMDAVMAAMETQPAADAMAHDGVLPETLVILVEA